MSMPISSVGPVAAAPILKLPGIQPKSAEQQALIDKVTASLPGNHKNTGEQHQELYRIGDDIARVSQTFNKKLKFIVDHQSHEVIVKVVDKDTDKVIKVIPPEELQRLHKTLKETIGFLFNEEV